MKNKIIILLFSLIMQLNFQIEHLKFNSKIFNIKSQKVDLCKSTFCF